MSFQTLASFPTPTWEMDADDVESGSAQIEVTSALAAHLGEDADSDFSALPTPSAHDADTVIFPTSAAATATANPDANTSADADASASADPSLASATADPADAPADFAAYVAERRSSLLRTAHQVAGDRTEAEDLLQEGLLKTYQAWHRIEDKAVVGSYLRRTMTNHQISQWRKRRVEEYPTDELPEHGYDGESMSQVEMRVAVARALMRLSARDREALSLRYYGSYTDTEIAERMGVSVGTVKSALWRALRKLRDDPALRPLASYVSQKSEWLSPQPQAQAA